MLGMTIPTFSIGLIPGYDSIGVVAPLILVLMRLIQGLCISGEGAGAAIFILEHQQNLRPGFVAGLVHGSNIAGTLLASLIGLFLNSFFPDNDLSWRFAFILGGLMGIVGFYFRLQVSETPIFVTLSEKKKTLKMPFLHVMHNAWRSMIITFALGACASSITYLVKTYMNVFFVQIKNFEVSTSLWFMSYASVVMMITMPISGYLSDRIGRLRMIRIAGKSVICLIFPSLLLMSYGQHLWQYLLAVTMLSVLAGLISGSAYIFIISLFTPEERFSGVAFSYNLGIAVFGGTSAIISTWLVNITGLHFSPAIYIVLTASLFLGTLYIMDKEVKSLLAEFS
jgi:MHS family proline/betaine transporter-like MFS transporter